MDAAAQEPAAGSAVQAQDRLGQRDFARLATFIQDYSGIKMPPNKITMVEGRLRRRVRATGLDSVTDYCRYLFDCGGLEAEAIHLIDAITTNKTEFFREPGHFKVLAESVLPELAAARRVDARSPVKIWSAACSTGAEVYTLAMVLAEFGRGQPGFRASILATDICTEVLEAALLGIYPESMMTPVPREFARRYLMRHRQAARPEVRIVPELRQMARFARLNLMDGAYPVERDMDVIFCRNILIYFDKPTQEVVLSRLCEHLRPGGHLFLGHSESLAGLRLPLRSVGKSVFRRG
ncbi:chemotaxis protein methyltransferase CheR [Tistlia consotensis]|uniref:Chemotaxis protein methyltransferase n=1 Tax=Tistlia consotensis USBA 355 TaxID=560819 RepID=A0A1Y6CXW9_9PROT|nr:protein-glutamate O-methyltransferase [Tistlia consotensis]SMF84836.1 chemotaxis protein methyltransferase CheR [Tistlia consotensis USBA 355]SNS08490.1 chemotaxis protein methyltransferase CheR [Tistlia consotensis]